MTASRLARAARGRGELLGSLRIQLVQELDRRVEVSLASEARVSEPERIQRRDELRVELHRLLVEAHGAFRPLEVVEALAEEVEGHWRVPADPQRIVQRADRSLRLAERALRLSEQVPSIDVLRFDPHRLLEAVRRALKVAELRVRVTGDDPPVGVVRIDLEVGLRELDDAAPVALLLERRELLAVRLAHSLHVLEQSGERALRNQAEEDARRRRQAAG